MHAFKRNRKKKRNRATDGASTWRGFSCLRPRHSTSSSCEALPPTAYKPPTQQQRQHSCFAYLSLRESKSERREEKREREREREKERKREREEKRKKHNQHRNLYKHVYFFFFVLRTPPPTFRRLDRTVQALERLG